MLFPYSHTRNHKRAFTLIETLVSTAIIMLVILGPLSVAITSSAYAKDTKNTIISSYLAQEGLELIRFKRDSAFIECLQGDVDCTPDALQAGSYENLREISWRVFKERLGPFGSYPSCFATDNPEGCAFDIYGFVRTAGDAGERYIASDTRCQYLARDDSADNIPSTSNGVTDYMYLCSTNAPSFTQTIFKRTVRITSVYPTLASAYDRQYADDLRVESTVTYAKGNGVQKTIRVIDYLHARP